MAAHRYHRRGLFAKLISIFVLILLVDGWTVDGLYVNNKAHLLLGCYAEVRQPSSVNRHPMQDPLPDYLKGRGAQINTRNRFLKNESTKEHVEGIDDWTESNVATQYIEQESKTIVNKVDSPDVGMMYSMNPYAGCEHGCIYCYARNVHEYWGYSAGLDFERKIIVKKNAPQLLRKFLMHPKWECVPLGMSGNTDCYQPAERIYRLNAGDAGSMQ